MTNTLEELQSAKLLLQMYLLILVLAMIGIASGELLYQVAPMKTIFDVASPEAGLNGKYVAAFCLFAGFLALLATVVALLPACRAVLMISDAGISVKAGDQTTHDAWDDLEKFYSVGSVSTLKTLILVRNDKSKVHLHGYRDMPKIEDAIAAHIGPEIQRSKEGNLRAVTTKIGIAFLYFFLIPGTIFIYRTYAHINDQTDGPLWPFGDLQVGAVILGVFAVPCLLYMAVRAIRKVPVTRGRTMNPRHFLDGFIPGACVFWLLSIFVFTTLSVMYTAYNAILS